VAVASVPESRASSPHMIVVAMLIGMLLAAMMPSTTIAGGPTGSVQVVLTLRGEVSPTDAFWMTLDSNYRPIIEPSVVVCADPSLDYGHVPRCRADHAYVRESGQQPVGTVIEYGITKDGQGEIPELSGTTTVTAGTTTISLTYDYDLGKLPNTASADVRPRMSTTGVGLIVAVLTLILFVLMRRRSLRR